MVKKKIQREVEVLVCDFCDKELDYSFPDRCVVCGKDVCDKHIAQWEEDGSICVDCGKEGYEIVYGEGEEEGGVCVEKNGEMVNALYL